MGYFPNGSAGADYETQYCDHCRHQGLDGDGCAVWLVHLLKNYDECNKDDSVLHILIPRDKDGWNEQCKMFIDRHPERCKDTADMFD